MLTRKQEEILHEAMKLKFDDSTFKSQFYNLSLKILKLEEDIIKNQDEIKNLKNKILKLTEKKPNRIKKLITKIKTVLNRNNKNNKEEYIDYVNRRDSFISDEPEEPEILKRKNYVGLNFRNIFYGVFVLLFLIFFVWTVNYCFFTPIKSNNKKHQSIFQIVKPKKIIKIKK